MLRAVIARFDVILFLFIGIHMPKSSKDISAVKDINTQLSAPANGKVEKPTMARTMLTAFRRYANREKRPNRSYKPFKKGSTYGVFTIAYEDDLCASDTLLLHMDSVDAEELERIQEIMRDEDRLGAISIEQLTTPGMVWELIGAEDDDRIPGQWCHAREAKGQDYTVYDEPHFTWI